jgi:1-aminocyclopropane-1-carboxylate deaminase/D-cysteine desulfhydrase-like pyridoxal-dependent ACC family enzyme
VSDVIAYEFSVTADANRKLTLSGVTFNLAGISGSGNVRLYEKGNSSNTISIATTATGVLQSELVASFSGTTFAEVSAGSSKTFVLEVTGVDTSSTANKDKTRTVRLDDITFRNDLTDITTDVVSVKNYNVIPTDSSTWKY